MKELRPILQILAAFVVVLIAINTIGNCATKRTSKVIVKSDLAIQRAALIDSMETAYATRDMAQEHALQRSKDSAIAKAQENAAYWERIALKRKQRADTAEQRADSMAKESPEECLEVIDAFRESNNELKSEKDAITNQLTAAEVEAQEWCEKSESLEREVQSLATVIFVKQSTINEQQVVIFDYEKRLKKHNNWWHRNTKWITASIGFGLGVMIIR